MVVYFPLGICERDFGITNPEEVDGKPLVEGEMAVPLRLAPLYIHEHALFKDFSHYWLNLMLRSSLFICKHFTLYADCLVAFLLVASTVWCSTIPVEILAKHRSLDESEWFSEDREFKVACKESKEYVLVKESL